MSEQFIYVVFGATGEYSDHNEWSIAAYYSKANAKEHVTKASNRANELQVIYRDNYWQMPDGSNEYDSDMRLDYTGTRYYIDKVRIADEPPK